MFATTVSDGLTQPSSWMVTYIFGHSHDIFYMLGSFHQSFSILYIHGRFAFLCLSGLLWFFSGQDTIDCYQQCFLIVSSILKSITYVKLKTNRFFHKVGTYFSFKKFFIWNRQKKRSFLACRAAVKFHFIVPQQTAEKTPERGSALAPPPPRSPTRVFAAWTTFPLSATSNLLQ